MHVPFDLYWKTRLVAATRPFWRALGNVESAILRDDIDAINIEKPVYVCSLARAGTTILVEMLNAHPDTTAHRYADFPIVYTPFWRNWFDRNSQIGSSKPEERAHGDRILVTRQSPEAVEEVLWMSFFADLHSDTGKQYFAQSETHPEFEEYYRDHIRKLLLARNAARYLSKGNYLLSRIPYLQSLFPDARFLVPLRDPLHHIASLMKQQKLFTLAQKQNPKIRWQLEQSGHYEFGEVIHWQNIDNQLDIKTLKSYWQSGKEHLAWGLYWSHVFTYVLKLVKSDKYRIALVDYHKLCSNSEAEIDKVLEFSSLSHEKFAKQKQYYSGYLQEPDYYTLPFDDMQKSELEDMLGGLYEELLALAI